MGCGWWNPPTPYKEDCYWYREEQDMNAHIPYCACKNQFPLDSCENCEDYHSRSKRTQGDRIRGMDDYDLAIFLENVSCKHADTESWFDWLRREVDNAKSEPAP